MVHAVLVPGLPAVKRMVTGAAALPALALVNAAIATGRRSRNSVASGRAEWLPCSGSLRSDTHKRRKVKQSLRNGKRSKFHRNLLIEIYRLVP